MCGLFVGRVLGNDPRPARFLARSQLELSPSWMTNASAHAPSLALDRPVSVAFLAAVGRLRDRITAVVHKARGVDLSSCEDKSVALLLDERRPLIRGTLVDAVAVAAYAGDLNFELAPLVKGELSSKLERLSALDGGQAAWEIGAELASARRRVIRSMTALDLAAAEDSGDQPRHTLAEELQASLRTRKMLAFFRKRLQSLGEPSNDALEAAVRTSGIEVSRMVCSETFSELRVHDRVQARQLQRRIMMWLRGGEKSGEQLVEGRYVFEDVVAFATLVSAVSQREDLVQHDLEMIRTAQRELAGQRLVSPIWHHRLRALEGRSEELDRLISLPGPLDAGALLSVLENIRVTLPGGSFDSITQTKENEGIHGDAEGITESDDGD